MNCIAQGYPAPNISWIRADGKPLPGGMAKFNVSYLLLTFHSLFKLNFGLIKGPILHVDNITKEDRGVYKCTATNLIGSGAEWTLKVSVRCKNKRFFCLLKPHYNTLFFYYLLYLIYFYL